MEKPQAHIERIEVIGDEQFDLDWEDRVLTVDRVHRFNDDAQEYEYVWTVTILRRG